MNPPADTGHSTYGEDAPDQDRHLPLAGRSKFAGANFGWGDRAACTMATITFPHDFPIGEPQHTIAPRTEIARTFGVVGNGRIGAVLIAVQFDNEFCTVAAEIGNVFGEGDLAAEMETNSLEIAKARPQDAFSVGRVLPKHPGKCVGHYPHPEPFTSAAPHPKNVSRFSTSPQGGG